VGVLDIYKPGQGVYARVSVVVLFGAFAALGLFELYFAVEDWSAMLAGAVPWKLVVVGSLALAAAAGIGLLVNARKPVDFLIVTEAEMRKVSWPTARQIRQQTIVVLLTTLVLGAIIYTADVLFVYLSMALYLR